MAFLPNEPILKIVEKRMIAESKVSFCRQNHASKRTQTKPFTGIASSFYSPLRVVKVVPPRRPAAAGQADLKFA
jgi:hypothetical protein